MASVEEDKVFMNEEDQGDSSTAAGSTVREGIVPFNSQTN